MVSISKPKLLAVSIILLVAGSSFYLGHVLGIPAPTTNSICEPGACGSNQCSYNVYLDTASISPITMIKNCVTGANDFSNADTATALQAMFNFMATVPNPNPTPPGGVPSGAQFVVRFSPGNYYFSKAVTVTLSSVSGGQGLSIIGDGDNRENLILNSGVNNDIFNITNAGSIFQMAYLKLEGQKSLQSGTSNCVEVSAPEIGFFHIELRDCLTNAIKVVGNGSPAGSNGWNIFEDVWILSCGTGGIALSGLVSYTDIRIIGSKFEACASGIWLQAGNIADVTITGNNFNNAGILFSIGAVKTISIVANIFWTSPTNVINFGGSALGSLTNFNTIISGNQFSTNTGTNVAILIGDFVDGVTVTSNQFAGYTSSSTVPVTLTQTHQKLTTLVTQNSGMGASWTGFGIAQPTVPATTVDQQNTNPYQVRIYVTAVGSGITAYKVTDPSGTSNTFTTTVNVGFTIDVDPYAKVALTYTGSPTWKWYGLANLT